ncbi:MAG: histidine phosphatase family protein [Clostridia bacterium]|nr:histidine phosphatase family protein [Clostridia bacterium]
MADGIIKLQVYLVRHGESMGNIGHAGQADVSFVDREDPMLSPDGERQAQLLGERFKSCPLNCVFSSGLRRTLSTANEVIKAQPENGAKEIEIIPELSETGVPDEYYGFTLPELQEKYPVKLADGLTAERMIVASKGTDDYWNLARAEKIWSYLLNRFNSGEKIMLTAHGCFNTSLFLSALKIPPQTGFDMSFSNTSVTKFIFYQPGTGRYGDDIKLSYHNDMSHLYNEFPEMVL